MSNKRLKYVDKQLNLVDIVPGKFYAINKSTSQENKVDLVSFECSEERGALRGFVKVFYGSTEVFPTEVFAKGHWLTVNTINQDGIHRPMRLDFDDNLKTLRLLSGSVLITEPIVNMYRTNIDNAIKIKEQEIARLRTMYDMLDDRR